MNGGVFDGQYAAQPEAAPLAEMNPGRFRLVRVDDSDSDLLNWLREADLRPGRTYEMVSRDSVAGVIEISSDSGGLVRVGDKVASQILVQPLT